MMDRRVFAGALAGFCSVGPHGILAQTGGPTRRIGLLIPYRRDDAVVAERVAVLRAELARQGWPSDQSVEITEHWTSDDLEQVRIAADDLVSRNVEVIVTTGSRVVPIARRATQSIPIIFVGTSDPVGQGMVASLARPGGNITGFSLLEFDGETSPLMGKLFDLIRRIAPGTTRMAIMFNPANPATGFHTRTFLETAAAFKVHPTQSQVRSADEIEAAIRTIAAEGNGAMVLPSDLTLLGQRATIVDLMARYRMPAIYSDRSFVESGGLISYSADRREMFRQAAGYVTRILRGEKPGDLPVQQPTRYELVVNLRTARALHLTIPPDILIQADEVIE